MVKSHEKNKVNVSKNEAPVTGALRACVRAEFFRNPAAEGVRFKNEVSCLVFRQNPIRLVVLLVVKAQGCQSQVLWQSKV
jgi:hypothetical protein